MPDARGREAEHVRSFPGALPACYRLQMRVELIGAVLAAALLAAAVTPASATEPDDAARRGEYIFHAGACDSCHTNHPNDGAFLAGGRAMESPFGTFYTPNITPAPESGIGHWTAEDFTRSMVEGVSPDGQHYYPIFPYRWYTGMTDRDLADLWAYLQTVPPVENAVQSHDLQFPFNYRFLLLGWKLINFDQGETVHDPSQPEAWNRGAYLVNHLGHCGACHTPKLFGGIFLEYDFLAGSEAIPGPYPAPNLTPHRPTGLADWEIDDIVRALKRAINPEGLPIRGPMAEYVDSGSSYLSEEDLAAAALYLKSIEAEEGPVAQREERLDRRLLPESEGQSGSDGESGGGGTGSSGIRLLTAATGGRTLAK